MGAAVYGIDEKPAQTVYVNNEMIQSGRVFGSGTPEMFKKFVRSKGDPYAFRQYSYDGENTFQDVRNEKGELEPKLISNTTPATLRFQDWRLIDAEVAEVAKPNLSFIGALRAKGLETTLPNGMAHSIYSYERGSDTSKAEIGMDPARKSQSDRSVFDMVNLPLPLVYKDVKLGVREVMASQNGNSRLDLRAIRQGTERVTEGLEQLALGVWPTFSFAGATVYGATNYTSRMTKTITSPTAAGWTPATMVQEVLAMRLQSQLAYHKGPWGLYTSPNLDPYLDEDYSPAKGDGTLRDRLAKIKGITSIETVDYLQFLTGTPYTILMIEQHDRTVRMVVYMDVMAIQWEEPGSFEWNAKIIGGMVPQWRADMNNNTGVVHGSAAYG